MLLRADGEDVICIGQPAHAWISGQLARVWGNELFGAFEPWEDVCLAALQHDVGMSAIDAAPQLNPETGRPRSFLEWPLAAKLKMWRAAPGALLSQSPYAALLASRHGHALYARLDPATRGPEVDRFLAGEERRQDALIEALGADRTALARNQRLLWTWDSMSLALCLDWAPYTLREVPAARGVLDVELTPAGAGRVAVAPWPFAVPELRVRAEGRRLSGRFEDQGALRAAWDAAPWVTVTVAVSPWEPSASSTSPGLS